MAIFLTGSTLGVLQHLQAHCLAEVAEAYPKGSLQEPKKLLVRCIEHVLTLRTGEDLVTEGFLCELLMTDHRTLPRMASEPGTVAVFGRENLHGFERRSNALVGDATSRLRGAVSSCCWASVQPGQSDEGIPVTTTATTSGPFRCILLTHRADVRYNDALLEVQRFLELDDCLFHVLFAQEQVSHDLVVIDELIVRSFHGREDIECLIDHLQPVIQLAEIELENGIIRILLQGLLIGPDYFTWFSLFQEVLFQAVENNDVPGLRIHLFQDFHRILGFAFADQHFAQPDVSGKERAIFLDRAAEIATRLVGMPPL